MTAPTIEPALETECDSDVDAIVVETDDSVIKFDVEELEGDVRISTSVALVAVEKVAL
jgi:hypothetical protein